ncbi:MAG: hypothetical protein SFX73_10380 [Kofleriaceae bacterium]|nr:hypothetical protein [Kofleriaceae bacterium]
MKRRTLLALAITVTALAAIAGRVVFAGRLALADGDEAAAAGRLDEAIANWERAARWYLPLAPHVDDAYARLTDLATRSHPHALSAWRAVRSASLATRTLWTPHADDLAAANAQIAELSSRDPAGAASGGPDAASRKPFHVERLAHDPRLSRAAAALALLGIGTWLGGLAYLVRRGLDAHQRFVRRPAAIGGGTALAGLALWLVALGL